MVSISESFSSLVLFVDFVLQKLLVSPVWDMGNGPPELGFLKNGVCAVEGQIGACTAREP